MKQVRGVKVQEVDGFGYLVESYQYGSTGIKSVPNGDTGFDIRDLNT